MKTASNWLDPPQMRDRIGRKPYGQMGPLGEMQLHTLQDLVFGRDW
jgi:hypothetical protein